MIKGLTSVVLFVAAVLNVTGQQQQQQQQLLAAFYGPSTWDAAVVDPDNYGCNVNLTTEGQHDEDFNDG